MGPRTWILVISTGDLQRVKRLPTNKIPDMLQHLPIARRDRVPVEEIRRVKFDPDDEILRNALADFGDYPTR